MSVKFDDLTIGQAKELAKMFGSCMIAEQKNSLDDFAIGEHVIIRTNTAGVWCGKLERKAKNEVILSTARRMWSWWCKESISLSGVVKHGIIQRKSKIAPAIDQVWLEAIEIMPIIGDPLKSIMEAPDAVAE